MLTKRIANPTTFRNADNSRIRCRGTTVAGAILFTLGFVSTLAGIGVLPAAYADPKSAQCAQTQGMAMTPGGEAPWKKCTKEGTTYILVTVKDTLPDGKCAQAMIDFDNLRTEWSSQVCDKQAPVDFNYSWRAEDATVTVTVK